jgi:hypothetical protein
MSTESLPSRPHLSWIHCHTAIAVGNSQRHPLGFALTAMLMGQLNPFQGL